MKCWMKLTIELKTRKMKLRKKIYLSLILKIVILKRGRIILNDTKWNHKKDNMSLVRSMIFAGICPLIYILNSHVKGTELEFLIIPDLIVLSLLYYWLVAHESKNDCYFRTQKERRRIFYGVQLIAVIVVGRDPDYEGVELVLHGLAVIVGGELIMLISRLINKVKN